MPDRTGLQLEQAKGAAKAVLEFLKAAFRRRIASNLDSTVSDGATTEAGGRMLENAAAKLGNMFGKDKPTQ